MRLALSVDRDDARNWHVQLADDLRADGHEVVVTANAGTSGGPRPERFGRRVERALYGIPGDHPTARLASARRTALVAPDGAPVDLVIDLGGGGADAPIIAPLFDAMRDEDHVVCALSHSPSLAIALQDRPLELPRVVALASPAITDRGVLVRALDQYAHGVARALRQTVKRIATGQPLPTVAPDDRQVPTAGRRGSFVARSLSAKVAARLRRLETGHDQWRIGVRKVAGDGVRDTLAWADSPYRFIRDDGRRYYADPFLYVHEGVVHGFCEELVYATAKGIISHFTVGPDGSTSTPRPVLERPYHLSYPQVFAHAGDLFMIPETIGNRTVELFRAVRFPHRWEKVGDLMSDVSAADATLVVHDGRFWLFAAIADDGGSDRDALGLFYADDLIGPWTPHPLNPVALDVRAARPGGHLYRRSGALMRPAQDCRAGYGAGLTLCEVTRLDPEGYEQRIVACLAPQARWRARGAHTLNQAGGFEVIDCLTPRRRFPG